MYNLREVDIICNGSIIANNMFRSDSSLRVIHNLIIPNAYNFYYVFEGCQNLRTVQNVVASSINFWQQHYLTDMHNITLTSNAAYFASGCTNLVNISNINVSTCKNFYSMFAGCSNLVNVPDFDTSNGTFFREMFSGCSKLSVAPNINMSKSTNAAYMFASCYSMTSTGNLNTATIRDASGMFNGCTNLQNLSSLNLQNVENAYEMFCGCTKLTGDIDMSIFNSNKLSSAVRLFSGTGISSISNFTSSEYCNVAVLLGGCNNITSVDFTDWNVNMSNAQNLSYFFSECHGLTNVANIDMRSATAMDRMFSNCEMLESVELMNTQNVRTMVQTFYNAKQLHTIPIMNTINVTTLNNCFYLSGLINADFGSWDLNNCTDVNGIFYSCHNLVKLSNVCAPNATGWLVSYLPNLTTLENIHINGGVSFGEIRNIQYISNVTVASTMNRFINDNYNIRSITNFKTTGYDYNCGWVMCNCSNLTTVENISAVSMQNVSNFVSRTPVIEIKDINLCYTINSSYMFYSNPLLTTVANLNLYSLQNGNCMFMYCNNLQNVSNITMPNIKNIIQMFYGCRNLTDDSIQNIINVYLNCPNILASYKNLSSANSSGPFAATDIVNTRYQNRWDELTAAGWTF